MRGGKDIEKQTCDKWPRKTANNAFTVYVCSISKISLYMRKLMNNVNLRKKQLKQYIGSLNL